MNVRTDSWHYKVWAWSHLEKSDCDELKSMNTSLCPYFWRVMLAFVWLPPVVILILLSKICLVPFKCLFEREMPRSKMYHPFYRFENIAEEFIFGLVLLTLAVLAILVISQTISDVGWLMFFKAVALSLLRVIIIVAELAAALALLAGFAFVYVKFEKWKEPSDTKPSLAQSYLSAVKQKVCPTINFVDKE